MTKKAKNSKTPAKKKQSKKAAEKVLRSGPVRRKVEKPRDQALPGMEDVRYRDLDASCNSIAETREEINALSHLEADYENRALAQMRKHEVTTYRHAGVELARVPGEEKLRVRTTRERSATAEVEEVEPDEKGDTTDVQPMDADTEPF